MTNRHFTKYIQQYSEPLIQSLALTINDDKRLSSFRFSDVVVIPAYKESKEFINRFLASKLAQLPVLVIVVVNQPDTEVDKEPQTTLYNQLLNVGEHVYSCDNLTIVAPENSQCHLCCINAFSEPLPSKQGVGLARKLGTDLAILFKENDQIKSDWIHSTDADATLPENYFEAVAPLSTKEYTAVSYNFFHMSLDRDVHAANLQYETALRYYVAGLEYAKSSYAFYTIGSALAFTAQAYVQVRGFPKKSAGEDFYLLNKLAKQGRVEFLNDSVILIEARESNRVPFGTGPTVSKIMELDKNLEPYCYYHPELFIELKVCLQHFEILWQQRLSLDSWMSKLSIEAQDSLTENGFITFVNKQSGTNQEQFNKQLLVWFDAFKTLKFLHGLRERKYQDIPLNEALEKACFYQYDSSL